MASDRYCTPLYIIYSIYACMYIVPIKAVTNFYIWIDRPFFPLLPRIVRGLADEKMKIILKKMRKSRVGNAKERNIQKTNSDQRRSQL